MIITYAFKLYHNPQKFRYLEKLLDIACEVYNESLEYKRKKWTDEKLSIGQFDLYKVNQDKRNSNEFKHWNELVVLGIRDPVDRICNGYQLFFDSAKTAGGRIRPPQFKKRSHYKSITFTKPENGYKLLRTEGMVRIGSSRGEHKGKWFRYHKSREIEGTVKTLTVKKNKLGEWFIYITVEQNQEQQETNKKLLSRTGKSVGLDFGLKMFLTGSDGSEYQSPLFFNQARREIRKLNKQLHRKTLGSKNRTKARLALARAYDRIANKRFNYHWQLALKLLKRYDTIFIEDLNLVGMKKLWGRRINDLGFYFFVQILTYLASKYGKQVIKIDRFFPSSKQCSSCSHINNDLSLRDREWTCPDCCKTHQRDKNAAINILNEGCRKLSSDTDSCRDFVRPIASVRKRWQKSMKQDQAEQSV